VLRELALCLWREKNGAVTIGLEVNTNVVVLCSMMKMFYTGGYTSDWKTLKYKSE
jgi:hypothetical protein